MTLRTLLQQINTNILHGCDDFHYNDVDDPRLDYELTFSDCEHWQSHPIVRFDVIDDTKEIILRCD